MKIFKKGHHLYCCTDFIFDRKSTGVYGVCIKNSAYKLTHHTPVEFPGPLKTGMKFPSIEWYQCLFYVYGQTMIIF